MTRIPGLRGAIPPRVLEAELLALCLGWGLPPFFLSTRGGFGPRPFLTMREEGGYLSLRRWLAARVLIDTGVKQVAQK